MWRQIAALRPARTAERVVRALNTSEPPLPPVPSRSPYQWLLILVGFDAADEVGLASGQDFH